jgi:acetoin utilization deacetylase AcuC-like enzyme
MIHIRRILPFIQAVVKSLLTTTLRYLVKFLLPRNISVGESTRYFQVISLKSKMLPRAAIHAVDLLMQKFFHSSHDEYQRAFVVGRPPGHHAGPFG